MEGGVAELLGIPGGQNVHVQIKMFLTLGGKVSVYRAPQLLQ